MNSDTCIEELKIHVQNSWTNKESILRVKGRISFTGTYSPIIINNFNRGLGIYRDSTTNG